MSAVATSFNDNLSVVAGVFACAGGDPAPSHVGRNRDIFALPAFASIGLDFGAVDVSSANDVLTAANASLAGLCALYGVRGARSDSVATAAQRSVQKPVPPKP